MNDKITFPRLSSLLADKSGRSKRFSEDFLREFFALISETLETGESVKVKGMGTFRLSRVEPRKSIDVTTGLPMEISGHTKVVFTPAKELADAVNAPFEAFSTIEISDDIDLSQIFPTDDIEIQEDSDYQTEDIEISEEAADTITEITLETPPEDRSETSPAQISSIPEETTESIFSEKSEILDMSETSGFPEDSMDSGPADDATEEESQEEEECEDYEDSEPVKIRKRNRKRAMLISFVAAIVALVATLAVWYVFATNDFNRMLSIKTKITAQTSAASGDTDLDDKAEALTQEDTTSVEEASEPLASQALEESEVPTAPSDEVVYDTIGTTRYLTTMAKTHYGNFNLWPYIYEENKAILGHPDRIRPGTPVVIPKLSKYGVDASNKEDIDKAKKMGVEIYARYGKKI